MIVHGHPLKAVAQDLAIHRQCVELHLEGLSETAVSANLAQRLPGCAHLPELASVLYQRQDEPELLPLAHRALGTSLFWLGEFAPAWQHLEFGGTLATAHASYVYIAQYGEDPGLVCQLYGVLTLWALGYPDQAWQRMLEALHRAEMLAHPFSLGFALVNAAWLHQHRREALQAQARAEAAITLATQHEIAQWLALGTALRGWAVTMQGQGVTGVGQLQEGLAAFRATGPGDSRIPSRTSGHAGRGLGDGGADRGGAGYIRRGASGRRNHWRTALGSRAVSAEG